MAPPVISISSNVLVKSVGSFFPRVIPIGFIFVKVTVAPEVGAAAVASPVGVLKLDTHSTSEADPSESLPPPVSIAPMVSPFLCSDDSKSDTEIPSPRGMYHLHLMMLCLLEIPTAPIPPAPSAVVAPSTDIISHIDVPPEIRRRRAILIRLGQDIPIGRLYRTHPGGPCRVLTVRKSIIHSFWHSISGHSVSGHTPPVTTIADSSEPSRFVYPPLARTPQYREPYRRWRSAPLSTMYPPMISESSAGDSFSKSSDGPSRKRCRSSTAIVISSIHALRALVPSRADLLSPCKRFKDSISPEDSVEEDIDTDVLVDIEAYAMAIGVAADINVEAGVDAVIGIEVDVGVDVEDEVKGEVESNDRGTMVVGVDVVVGIDILD
ncbi:hypothetical protein Tco_1209079, partial [Tanacetum coccineum]